MRFAEVIPLAAFGLSLTCGRFGKFRKRRGLESCRLCSAWHIRTHMPAHKRHRAWVSQRQDLEVGCCGRQDIKELGARFDIQIYRNRRHHTRKKH